jgi:uncharacterized protein
MARAIFLAACLVLATVGAGVAAAAMQASASSLRATGLVGEQYDGYLGLVGAAPPRIRSEMDAVNIRRRAHYTGLAARRRVRVEEVAVAAGCEILASRVAAGEYYLLPDNIWRRREAAAPIARPGYCQ